jgi:hypothetical protein
LLIFSRIRRNPCLHCSTRSRWTQSFCTTPPTTGFIPRSTSESPSCRPLYHCEIFDKVTSTAWSRCPVWSLAERACSLSSNTSNSIAANVAQLWDRSFKTRPKSSKSASARIARAEVPSRSTRSRPCIETTKR